jgi:glycosyltransferase involved in cell wall biosynthesis
MSRRQGGLFIGRPTPENGIVTLTEALALHPGARVEIVDPGLDVRERMRSAAYLVLPSLACDELPRPLIEAFAHGLPVIASRIGLLAEAVESGRNGLLFEAGSARELARRLVWADAFPEKMRQMGECAKADYAARWGSNWSYQRLFGERRRAARV